MKKKNEDDKREITVSIDRIKLTLSRYRNKKSFIAELISYLGSILTLLITIVTGQYSGFWFLSAEALEGVFITLLIIMIIVTIFRMIYIVVIRSSVCNENSFVDSLEYKENSKSSQEINKKRKVIINVCLSICLTGLVTLYLGLGFLFKWRLAYCIFGSIAGLVGFIMFIANWESMFTYFYDKVKKKDLNISIDC